MMSKEQALHKAERHLSQLVKMVGRAIREGWRVDEFERASFTELLDLGFELLTAFVAAQGSGDEGPQVQREDRTLQRLEQRHERRYVSIYGPLQIPRWVYGTREGQKIEHVPLDAQLGLPAGEISYVLEDWLERMCVKDAYRDSVDSLVELLGMHTKVSVETAEKHTREMAEHAASFRASQPIPPPQEEGELLVVTADAKGVPMVRPAAEASPRASHRRGKGEKANKKQMAYVGATYSIDRFRRTADDIVDELLRKERAKTRPRPQHKRVRAEMTRPGDELLSGVLLHGPSHLFVGLAVECHERDPDRKKELICLLDGERQLWDLQREWLPRGRHLGYPARQRATLDGSPLLSCGEEFRCQPIRGALPAPALGRQGGLSDSFFPAPAGDSEAEGRTTQASHGHDHVLSEQPAAHAIRRVPGGWLSDWQRRGGRRLPSSGEGSNGGGRNALESGGCASHAQHPRLLPQRRLESLP